MNNGRPKRPPSNQAIRDAVEDPATSAPLAVFEVD